MWCFDYFLYVWLIPPLWYISNTISIYLKEMTYLIQSLAGKSDDPKFHSWNSLGAKRERTTSHKLSCDLPPPIQVRVLSCTWELTQVNKCKSFKNKVLSVTLFFWTSFLLSSGWCRLLIFQSLIHPVGLLCLSFCRLLSLWHRNRGHALAVYFFMFLRQVTL